MREDTIMENGVDGIEQSTETSGQRRPSVVTLQRMLNKVSQSPFHSQEKDGATYVMDNHERHTGQNGVQEHFQTSPRNEGSGRMAKMNPFYEYYLESANSGYLAEDPPTKTPGKLNLDSSFITPSEFQSSPLDIHFDVKTKQNGGKYPEINNELFQTQSNYQQELSQGSSVGQNSAANGDRNDGSLMSSNFFKTSTAQTQDQLENSDLIKSGVDGLFHATKKDNALSTTPAMGIFDKSPSGEVGSFISPLQEDDLFQSAESIVTNPFQKSAIKEFDLLESSQPKVENPFYTAATKDAFHPGSTNSEELFKKNKQDIPAGEKDLFGMHSKENLDIFSPSSTNSVNPFPSPITQELFQDVSSLDDPFGSSPSKQYEPFEDVSSKTPDVFQPLTLRDKFEMHHSPSLSSTSEMNLDLNSPPELFQKKRTPPPVPPKPGHKPPETFLTTPQEANHSLLQPTPFSQAQDPSASPEITHVSTFKRPPKPLPRIRHPRPEKSPKPERPPVPEKSPKPERPPMPEKSPKPERPPMPEAPLEPATPAQQTVDELDSRDLPPKIEPEPKFPRTPPKSSFKSLQKPIIRRKKKTPETKPVEPENFVVFEDILLIGQERCVDDWPEDSPELNPDFKPSGKFRLRRESVKVMGDSDGGSSEDQEKSHSKKKDKQLKMSIFSRRESKSKFPDDSKESKSRTLPLTRKPSKDYSSEMHMSAGESEDVEHMHYKKKTLKTKVNPLLRRASTNSVMMEGKRMNAPSPWESRDDGTAKKSEGRNNSVMRRQSEGAMLEYSTAEEEEGGEALRDQADTHAKKNKLKMKFVPQRGFANTTDKRADSSASRKGWKEKSPAEALGAHGYTPQMKENAVFDYPEKEELDDEELSGIEDSKLDGFTEDEEMEKVEEQDELDDPDIYRPQKKQSKLKPLKKLRLKNKAIQDPAGATSIEYMSEAAKAEWLAAQKDEQSMADMEDEDEDGDTDSLMEWWYTVEQWDEVPSDEEEKAIQEDESKSFTILADKATRGLRVFNKIFTERAESLWHSILMLHSIADDISEFHNKARIAGITGGTTTAVGGVAAIVGLALAPITFGATLAVTAVGVGVAAAGGIASASAAISDNVHSTHDRKKVEAILQEYEANLLDIGKVLHFVNQALGKLRGHPFLRSGTQHYSEDWEIRRAVQMITLVDSPVMRATEVTDEAVAELQGLFKGMDKYFTKDSRELKKSCKTEIVSQIKHVADVLNDAIVELNAIREELQDSTGYM